MVVCRKTFLKGILKLRLGLMVNGPCACGGMQVPRKIKVYWPPISEDRVSKPLTSPSWCGSKQTETAASDGCLYPGEAVTVLSTVKSEESVCKKRNSNNDKCQHQKMRVIKTKTMALLGVTATIRKYMYTRLYRLLYQTGYGKSTILLKWKINSLTAKRHRDTDSGASFMTILELK